MAKATLTGQRFGKLTVVEATGSDGRNTLSFFNVATSTIGGIVRGVNWA